MKPKKNPAPRRKHTRQLRGNIPKGASEKIANSPILKSAFNLRFCGIDSQMFDKFIRFDILNKF